MIQLAVVLHNANLHIHIHIQKAANQSEPVNTLYTFATWYTTCMLVLLMLDTKTDTHDADFRSHES